MLFHKIRLITVNSKNRTKHKNTVCGMNFTKLKQVIHIEPQCFKWLTTSCDWPVRSLNVCSASPDPVPPPPHVFAAYASNAALEQPAPK
jgi:hypothetical protein